MFEHTAPDSISETLECPICRCTLEEPLMLVGCGHIFCSKCLAQAFLASKTCPIDRLPVIDAKRQAVKAPVLIRELLNELQVKCVAGGGCEWQGRRDAFPLHACAGLNAVIESGTQPVASTSRITLEAHTCQHCHSTLPSDVSQSKHYLECTSIPIPCMWAPYGCEERVPRDALQNHLDQCIFAKLGNFFKRYDERIDNLQEDNQVLRARINSLEEALELGNERSRNALGAYYALSKSQSGSAKSNPKARSLEEDLASLQDKLNSVSLNLDSIDLRTEMQVQNEAMRLQEDLNGLRATIHGVRTQVWQLMMERDRERMPLGPIFRSALSPTQVPLGDAPDGGELESSEAPNTGRSGLRRWMSAGASATNMSLYAALQRDGARGPSLNKL